MKTSLMRSTDWTIRAFCDFSLPRPLSHLSWSLFWQYEPKNPASTVAILAQGTSWAVAVTQAFCA